jgi:hypothetical protein
VAVLWRMHHILHVMLLLLDWYIIFYVLLFSECVLCVTMTWLLVSHGLWYMKDFTSRAIGWTDWSMKCKCNVVESPSIVHDYFIPISKMDLFNQNVNDKVPFTHALLTSQTFTLHDDFYSFFLWGLLFHVHGQVVCKSFSTLALALLQTFLFECSSYGQFSQNG